MAKLLIGFVLTILLGAFLFLFEKDVDLLSPTPKVFGNSKSVEENKWFPNLPDKRDTSDLSLSSKSAILVDYDSADVIFAKDPREKLPAASTIKIMTALVALENGDLNETFTVSKNASEVGENSMALAPAEKLTLEELLYGLMLVSGNDAAVTIAEGIAGSQEKFVTMMNERAKQLGANDTKFVNTSGLDEDGRVQFTTAYDLAVISRFTWEKFPEFRMITATYNKFIDANESHKAFDLYNDTNLLTTYPGVKGIKPGFTWEAGLCLVTYAENEGKRLIGVILGSEDRRGEMIRLLDFGFAHYGIQVDHPALDL